MDERDQLRFDPPGGEATALALRAVHRQLLALVDHSYAAAAAAHGQHMRCGAKCSQCCIDGFRISRAEAHYLAAGLRELPDPQQQRVRERLQAPADGACPLLHDNLCSIYEHRPVICRLFGLLLVDETGRNLRCELNFNDLAPGDEVQALSLDTVHAMIREMEVAFYPPDPSTASTVREVADAVI